VKRSIVVAALGTAPTLAWGSSYYLPAILADPIAANLRLSRTAVFGVFSGALLVSALLGPTVGRAIDQHGGRGVLAISNLVLAAGLVLLGTAQGILTLTIAWTFLGVGMAMGLYDPAFATLTGLYGRAARGPITGITLIAGFRKHCRLAALSVPRRTFRLARCVSRMGGPARCCRTAPEPATDPEGTAP
jgi:MFS family permease